jgi:Protein of unknown function (DUF2786)
MRMMIDSNIIEKIQKLRAITGEHGATEDEAIAAEQRMFALLAKYNLELSEIPDTEPTKPHTAIESESAERPSTVWKQLLYAAVANLNFSECFTLRGSIYIVGTRANRIATFEMASYLIQTVQRLADEEAAEVPGEERRRFRHSFSEGCANRICERLEQMRLEAQAGCMKADNPNSLLPALADLYQSSRARVDDFITAHFGKLHHRTHYASVGHDGGYVTGYNTGDRVGLHRQVGGKHQRLIA